MAFQAVTPNWHDNLEAYLPIDCKWFHGGRKMAFQAVTPNWHDNLEAHLPYVDCFV